MLLVGLRRLPVRLQLIEPELCNEDSSGDPHPVHADIEKPENVAASEKEDFQNAKHVDRSPEGQFTFSGAVLASGQRQKNPRVSDRVCDRKQRRNRND